MVAAKPMIVLRRILPLVALISAASADTIFLKNGTRLEGSVLKEDGDVYVCSIFVTKNIKDERRIPKAEVARIERNDPSLKAFEEVAALLPTPDLLGLAGYQERIETASNFLQKNPGTTKAKDANQILLALSDEMKAIEKGAIKLNGKLIKPDERSLDAYDIDAAVLAARMKQLAEAGDYTGALRAFYEINQQLPASKAFKDSLPYAKEVLTAYRTQVSQLSTSHAERQRTRAVNLERMAPEERTRVANAQAAETAAIAARNAEEQKARVIWPTLDPNNKQQLDQMVTHADQQLNLINELITKNAPAEGGEAYRNALKEIQSTHEVEKLNAALESARNAGITGKYLTTLEEAAKAALPAEPQPQQ